MWGHSATIIIIIAPTKRGDILGTKKMGRPTDNPKRHEIKARIDDETSQILNDYCSQKNKSKAEGIRDGIHRLKPDLNKK